MAPGEVASGEVVPGEVVPGEVVPGEVVPAGPVARAGPARGSRRSRWVVALGLGLALVAAACGRTGGSGSEASTDASELREVAGAAQRSLVQGGLTRRYRVYVPPDLDGATRVPAVLVLHRVGNDPEVTAEVTGFDRQADASGFVVAYPEGTDLSWNAGFCCAPASTAGADDMGFLRALVGRLSADPLVDAARVYVVGFFAGAMMAYRFACEASDLVAGVGSVAGTMVLNDCRPSRPVSAIEVHGTADALVPYEGGELQPPGLRAASLAPPAADVAERWAVLDGCGLRPAEGGAPPIALQTWIGCAEGTRVQLVTVQGGTHTWYGPGLRPPDDGLDATAAIWRFLSGA